MRNAYMHIHSDRHARIISTSTRTIALGQGLVMNLHASGRMAAGLSADVAREVAAPCSSVVSLLTLLPTLSQALGLNHGRHNTMLRTTPRLGDLLVDDVEIPSGSLWNQHAHPLPGVPLSMKYSL